MRCSIPFRARTFIVAQVFAIAAVAADHPAPLPIPDVEAKTEAAMKPYTELIEHTDAKIEMVPVRGGKFVMGSPDSEKGR